MYVLRLSFVFAIIYFFWDYLVLRIIYIFSNFYKLSQDKRVQNKIKINETASNDAENINNEKILFSIQ